MTLVEGFDSSQMFTSKIAIMSAARKAKVRAYIRKRGPLYLRIWGPYEDIHWTVLVGFDSKAKIVQWLNKADPLFAQKLAYQGDAYAALEETPPVNAQGVQVSYRPAMHWPHYAVHDGPPPNDQIMTSVIHALDAWHFEEVLYAMAECHMNSVKIPWFWGGYNARHDMVGGAFYDLSTVQPHQAKEQGPYWIRSLRLLKDLGGFRTHFFASRLLRQFNNRIRSRKEAEILERLIFEHEILDEQARLIPLDAMYMLLVIQYFANCNSKDFLCTKLRKMIALYFVPRETLL
jgi:hypothetical protein